METDLKSDDAAGHVHRDEAWAGFRSEGYPLTYFVNRWARVANQLLRLSRMDRIPNSYASPYLYLVARRSRGFRESG